MSFTTRETQSKTEFPTPLNRTRGYRKRKVTRACLMTGPDSIQQ